MKIEQIDWNWLRRNLHEEGFKKLVETLNLLINRANGEPDPIDEIEMKKSND